MAHCSYTDRQVAEADSIFAVDPESREKIQLWGQECYVGPGPTSGSFRALRSLEVDVDDLAPQAVLSLIAQVERVKGTIPREVHRIREKWRPQTD